MSTAFRLCPKTIDSASALFQRTWIPIKVMMNDVATIEMEINPLRHDAAGDQNFRVEGRIEGQHDPVTRFLQSSPIDSPHIGHQSCPFALRSFIFIERLFNLWASMRSTLQPLECFEIVLSIIITCSLRQEIQKLPNDVSQTQTGCVFPLEHIRDPLVGSQRARQVGKPNQECGST